jgi:outer membrane biosynthesis protein TonB
MAARERRTLIAAFALSLLIHLLAGPFVRKTDVPEPTASSYPFTIETARPKPSPPTPRATPTPKPQKTRPPESRPNPIAPPHQSHHNPRVANAPAPPSHPGSGGPGPGTGGHGPASDGIASPTPSPLAAELPTPAPTIAPTATPACAHPNVAASTVEAASVDTPSLAQQNGISGVVDVIVRLDEHSRVVAARVAHTPSTLLNDAALRAARTSTFRTEVRDCLPVAAEYVFSVEFDGQ